MYMYICIYIYLHIVSCLCGPCIYLLQTLFLSTFRFLRSQKNSTGGRKNSLISLASTFQ